MTNNIDGDAMVDRTRYDAWGRMVISEKERFDAYLAQLSEQERTMVLVSIVKANCEGLGMPVENARKRYNSILCKMQEDGRSDDDIQMVAEYLFGNQRSGQEAQDKLER